MLRGQPSLAQALVANDRRLASELNGLRSDGWKIVYDAQAGARTVVRIYPFYTWIDKSGRQRTGLIVVPNCNLPDRIRRTRETPDAIASRLTRAFRDARAYQDLVPRFDQPAANRPTFPNERASFDREQGVPFYGPEQRRQFVVSLETGGLIRDPRGDPLSTSAAPNGRSLFVQAPDGTLYFVGNPTDHAGDTGAFPQHSSFLAGGDVATAGEWGLRVYRGRDGVERQALTYLSNQSGHYEPDFASMADLLRRLQQSGVDLRYMRIDVFGEVDSDTPGGR